MRTTPLWIAAAVTACSPDTHDGSQVGTETGFGCVVDTTEAVDDTSLVPTGFEASVATLLEPASGRFEGILTHDGDDGGEALVLTLTPRGAPAVLRRAWKDDGSGRELALAFDTACLDAVRQPVTLELTSGTALTETAEVDVIVDRDGAGSLHLALDLDDLAGDATPRSFDPTTMDAVRFLVRGAATATGWDGEVDFQGESTSGTGPDATASATRDAWGSFTTARAATP
ncbi:MAG: hypothetical protein H6732_07160 [Alphaproteobacteria bacterium]|nr:hypothetical protein [Alphaproteobacteria bacterium]